MKEEDVHYDPKELEDFRKRLDACPAVETFRYRWLDREPDIDSPYYPPQALKKIPHPKVYTLREIERME